MPAVSKAQRQAVTIAEHHPDQLYDRNKSLLKMSHTQLHDFAATKESGLPERVSPSETVQRHNAKRPRHRQANPDRATSLIETLRARKK